MGNKIGTKAAGIGALPNGLGGINLGGGTLTQVSDNVIAYHGGAGDSGIFLGNAATAFLASSVDNCVFGNAMGVDNQTGAGVTFESNWWGDASGPGAPGGAGSGDPVSSNVDFAPFLAAMPPSCTFSPAELLTNGDFEGDADADDVPDAWIPMSLLVPPDGYTCGPGNCTVKLNGDGTSKLLRQVLTISGNAGEQFTLTARSRATNVPVGGDYRVQVRITYQDLTADTFQLNFAAGTHAWETLTAPFGAAKSYAKIRVTVRYANSSGSVRFDDVSLTINP